MVRGNDRAYGIEAILSQRQLKNLAKKLMLQIKLIFYHFPVFYTSFQLFVPNIDFFLFCAYCGMYVEFSASSDTTTVALLSFPIV